VFIWYIFAGFGIMYQENLATLMLKRLNIELKFLFFIHFLAKIFPNYNIGLSLSWLQLNGTWQSDLSVSSGKTDVYFDDGVSKIDMVLAFEETQENSRKRCLDFVLIFSFAKNGAFDSKQS
jgi:hypothetical protein